MHPGQVGLIYFPFTASEPWKKRPVLVLGRTPRGCAGDDCILVAMITGSPNRVNNPRDGDVVIGNWQAANLVKQSVVRARRVFSAEPRDFHKFLGEVPKAVLDAVRNEVDAILHS